MGLLPPLFLDAVVAVGEINAEGKKAFFGTGFYYGLRTGDPVPEGQPGKYQLFLITNRHVAERIGDTALIRFNSLDRESWVEFPIATRAPTGWPVFVAHPDPEVDVAATTLSTAMLEKNGLHPAFFQNDGQAATLLEMKDVLGVSDGDGIYVLGFPLGLVGDTRNTVIVRGGVVARLRDTYSSNSKTFLVDANVFPGNSGGPVILRPEGLAVPGTKHQLSSVLIGIVYGYVPYAENAYSLNPLQPRITFIENSGLGWVHTVDAINETIAYLKDKQDEWGGRKPVVAVAPEDPPSTK